MEFTWLRAFHCLAAPHMTFDVARRAVALGSVTGSGRKSRRIPAVPIMTLACFRLSCLLVLKFVVVLPLASANRTG